MRVHEQFEMFNIFCKQQIATLHIAQKQSKKKNQQQQTKRFPHSYFSAFASHTPLVRIYLTKIPFLWIIWTHDESEARCNRTGYIHSACG